MSDSFAIAAVTATLAYLIGLKGITVQTIPPDKQQTGETATLNIFLYQIAQNIGYRNRDVPTRSYLGRELLSKQEIGLDLYYLLTSYGAKNDELSAQKTMAEVVKVLHEHSFLSRDLIKKAIAVSESRSLLLGIGKANLANQVEPVKITMQNLSLEDLTKIWSSFFKEGSYRISVAYKATVVLLDGEEEPRTAMPIKDRNIYAIAPLQPQITSIEPQMVTWNADSLPPTWDEVTIKGTNLRAVDVRIDLGEDLELDILPKPVSVANDKITIKLSSTIPAGLKQVRIIHPLLIGTPKKIHKGLESNIALFALVPSIISINPLSLVALSNLIVHFEPALSGDQQVKVIVGTYKPIQPKTVTSGSNSIEVTIPKEFEAGTYPVRIRIDGAESQPDKKEWNNEYGRPFVTIT
jgi:hypothetical protein